MKVPDKVLKSLREELWEKADEIGWSSIGAQQKSVHYEQWSLSPDVGGRLGRYMDKADIRVYLKDTVMKPYARKRSGDATPALAASGIKDVMAVKDYEKPHGRLLFDNRIVCWGPAKVWKSVLLSVFERAYREPAVPYAAVLFRGIGKMAQPSERELVNEMAKRLGVAHVVWVD